jgi:hypothetical protein
MRYFQLGPLRDLSGKTRDAEILDVLRLSRAREETSRRQSGRIVSPESQIVNRDARLLFQRNLQTEAGKAFAVVETIISPPAFFIVKELWPGFGYQRQTTGLQYE